MTFAVVELLLVALEESVCTRIFSGLVQFLQESTYAELGA